MTDSTLSTSSHTESEALIQHADAMNRMYRWTRYVYDLSRKYYLIGRDQMLDGMELKPGDRILEVGCGTGRNLIRLAKRCPEAQFYGLDIAQVMVDQANGNIRKNNLESRVFLECCAAETLKDPFKFKNVEKFDVVYFSYSLSMIPTWESALEAAWGRLKTGGQLQVVDFWDQSGWPDWFARMLTRWLTWFGVHFRAELLSALKSWEDQGKAEMELISIQRNYAYLAKLIKI